MAMVRIKKGAHIAKVSKHAYETIFKKKGYVLVGERKTRTEVKNEPVEEKLTDADAMAMEEVEETDIDSIPISEMTKEQLKKFAESHNIDTSSAKSMREAKRIVQEAIKKSKM